MVIIIATNYRTHRQGRARSPTRACWRWRSVGREAVPSQLTACLPAVDTVSSMSLLGAQALPNIPGAKASPPKGNSVSVWHPQSQLRRGQRPLPIISRAALLCVLGQWLSFSKDPPSEKGVVSKLNEGIFTIPHAHHHVLNNRHPLCSRPVSWFSLLTHGGHGGQRQEARELLRLPALHHAPAGQWRCPAP